MDQSYLREIAAQLRKPTGNFGIEVALNMNVSNRTMNLNSIDALQARDGETILEVGMANGMFVKDILNSARGLKYIGCDYSEDMVQNANSINKEVVADGSAYFHQAAAQNLPLKDGVIDKILTVNTIYFWEKSSQVLQEFRRVLRNDGFLILSFRPESCMLKYPSTQFNFEYFEKDDVIELLATNGFEVSDIYENTELQVEIDGRMITPKHIIIVSRSVHA